MDCRTKLPSTDSFMLSTTFCSLQVLCKGSREVRYDVIYSSFTGIGKA
jgi:hypothetical protein